MKIKKVIANEILDSRGEPTVACSVILEDGSIGLSSVPSGASTGKYEAVELRDNNPQRFLGRGVLRAVNNVNNILASTVIDMNAEEQEQIDKKMLEADGTEKKSNLGANAILAVSLATAKAEAIAEKKTLYEYLSKFNPDHKEIYTMPIPEMNIMNGGKHADFATDFQEYMLFPIGAKSVVEAVRMNAEIYANLKKILKKKNYAITVGDEGGFAPPNLVSNQEPFELIGQAVELSGYTLGENVYLGIDAAASEFFSEHKYALKKEGKILGSSELSDFYCDIVKRYPIISMEDVFDQDDWESFTKFTALIGNKIQIVGDDLYVTNIKRIESGLERKATNSVLIKLNQIGSLTETIQAILLVRSKGIKSIVSHRSGETEDTFISDFAVAMGVGQIKSGAPARGERVAKYNRLMQIENELKEKAQYYSLRLI